MNLEKDLKQLKKQKQLKESAIAQLRKRSKDSVARPRAEKNITTTNIEIPRPISNTYSLSIIPFKYGFNLGKINKVMT